MKKRMFQSLVPRAWTGDQALRAVTLLRAIIDAIWAIHGEDMAVAIGDWPQEQWPDLMNCDLKDEDDIPF